MRYTVPRAQIHTVPLLFMQSIPIQYHANMSMCVKHKQFSLSTTLDLTSFESRDNRYVR